MPRSGHGGGSVPTSAGHRASTTMSPSLSQACSSAPSPTPTLTPASATPSWARSQAAAAVANAPSAQSSDSSPAAVEQYRHRQHQQRRPIPAGGDHCIRPQLATSWSTNGSGVATDSALRKRGRPPSGEASDRAGAVGGRRSCSPAAGGVPSGRCGRRARVWRLTAAAQTDGRIVAIAGAIDVKGNGTASAEVHA
jgi:hypothetical protein